MTVYLHYLSVLNKNSNSEKLINNKTNNNNKAYFFTKQVKRKLKLKVAKSLDRGLSRPPPVRTIQVQLSMVIQRFVTYALVQQKKRKTSMVILLDKDLVRT